MGIKQTDTSKQQARMSSSKLRVLCLHGYRQTGDKLRVRISGFRRAFKSSVEFGACTRLECALRSIASID